MNEEKITYTELSVLKNTKRQQIKPKGTASVTEREVAYSELKFRNASQDSQENNKHCQCKGLPSLPEKLLAGILGFICLSLLSCVITVIFIPNSGEHELSDNSTTEIPKAHCCGSNSKEWFIYSNNCYYYSTEKKTWKESVMACASESSHMVYIETEEEKKFLDSLSLLTWIGTLHNNTVEPCRTKNCVAPVRSGTDSASDKKNCSVLYSLDFVPMDCETLSMYYCKHQLRQ